MSGEPKVLLFRLFEKTSANGNRYLFGRLGNAKVVAFIDKDTELKFGATACFNVFLQPGDDGKQQQQSSGSQRQQQGAPRQARQQCRDAGSDGRPFDDPVGDLG